MRAKPEVRIPPAVLDAVLTAVFLAVGQLESIPHFSTDGYQAGPRAVNVVLSVVFAAPLIIRRRAPRTSFLLMHAALVLPGLVTYHSIFFFAHQLPSMLTTYTVARYGRGRLARWSWLSGVAFPLALFLGAPREIVRQQLSSPVLFLLTALLAWGAGRVVRRLAEQGEQLADALARLAAEQAARRATAVAAERGRIAVEMHDVVAHAVSLMVLQVGAARRELAAEGLDVPRLASAEQTGQQAMLELRRILGVLNDPGRPGPGDLPGMAATAELADRFRAAGLDLRLDLPEDGDLPTSVQLTAYRILQEALTNVLKHGRRESVVATVLANGTEVVISVRNRLAEGTSTPPVPSGRNGLIGMRERVALFGGSLSAGRAADGFEVRAVLPLAGIPAAAAGEPAC